MLIWWNRYRAEGPLLSPADSAGGPTAHLLHIGLTHPVHPSVPLAPAVSAHPKSWNRQVFICFGALRVQVPIFPKEEHPQPSCSAGAQPLCSFVC